MLYSGMLFNLENPSYSLTLSGAQTDMPAPVVPLLPPSSESSPSMPSSGDSTCRNCPRCRERMSSFTVDCHCLCCKSRGSNCNTENRCDEYELVCGGDGVTLNYLSLLLVRVG